MSADERSDKQQNIDVGRDLDVGRDFTIGDRVGGDKNTAGGDINRTDIAGDQHNYKADGDIHIHEAPKQELTREEKKARELRQRLIEIVRYTWIDSILKPAIENDIYIELGMSKQHNAIPQPGRRLLPDEEPLPEGTRIQDLFMKHGKKLLILGEPASGKTITLLTLADQLLTSAAQEGNDDPIPVVLNLASWARERSDLVTWLGEEMAHSYSMGREAARTWSKDGSLVLLLDGLDEVAEAHRRACLKAINAFQADYDVPMVVCSRIKDYEALQAQLNLTMAVTIESLSVSQIDSYLARFGETVAGVRHAVQSNQTLQELAQSPLMLSLMPLAYEGVSAKALDTAETTDIGRDRLLQSYVNKVFARRALSEAEPYTKAEAARWLSFIAQGLYSHKETIFRLEELQPTWLPSKKIRRRHRLIYRLSDWIIFGLLLGMPIGLLIGLLIGLPNALLGSLFGGLLGALTLGLFFGLTLGIISGITDGLKDKISFISIVDEEVIFIPPVKEWWSFIKKILNAWLIHLKNNWISERRFLKRVFELIFWLLFGLLSELIDVLVQRNLLPYHRLMPNHGLFRLDKQAFLFILILFTLLFGLFFGLLFWLMDGLLVGLVGGLRSGLLGGVLGGLFGGLLFGLPFGMSLGLHSGLRNLVSHYTIRHLLDKASLLPYRWTGWRNSDRDRELVAFLDSMADRWLLRRVGNGWVFRHRYLLEYFAERSPVKLDPVGGSDE